MKTSRSKPMTSSSSPLTSTTWRVFSGVSSNVKLAIGPKNTAVSVPSPPSAMSLPGPPITMSLPARAEMVSSPASPLMMSSPFVPTRTSSPAVAAATACAANAVEGAENTASGMPSASVNLPTTRILKPSSSRAGVGVNVGPVIRPSVTGSSIGAQSPAPGVASNSHVKVKSEIGGSGPSPSEIPLRLRTANVSPTLKPGPETSLVIVISAGRSRPNCRCSDRGRCCDSQN